MNTNAIDWMMTPPICLPQYQIPRFNSPQQVIFKWNGNFPSLILSSPSLECKEIIYLSKCTAVSVDFELFSSSSFFYSLSLPPSSLDTSHDKLNTVNTVHTEKWSHSSDHLMMEQFLIDSRHNLVRSVYFYSHFHISSSSHLRVTVQVSSMSHSLMLWIIDQPDTCNSF